MFTLAAKLSTHKYFHKRKKVSRTDSNSSKEGASEEFLDEDFAFFAIHMVHLCVHSRTLALVNAANYVLYFKFDNNEQNTEVVVCALAKVCNREQISITLTNGKRFFSLSTS